MAFPASSAMFDMVVVVALQASSTALFASFAQLSNVFDFSLIKSIVSLTSTSKPSSKPTPREAPTSKVN